MSNRAALPAWLYRVDRLDRETIIRAVRFVMNEETGRPTRDEIIAALKEPADVEQILASAAEHIEHVKKLLERAKQPLVQ